MCRGRRKEIVNFMTPGPGVPVIGCGHIGQTVKINAQNSENKLQKKVSSSDLKMNHFQIRLAQYVLK